MTVESVCLTLIAARRLRDELFDFLSEQHDLVSGFTASDCAGFGPTIRLPSAPEQVKGHADQVLVRIILQKVQAAELLSRIKTAYAGTRLVYWITPVTEFGTLDDRSIETGH